MSPSPIVEVCVNSRARPNTSRTFCRLRVNIEADGNFSLDSLRLNLCSDIATPQDIAPGDLFFVLEPDRKPVMGGAIFESRAALQSDKSGAYIIARPIGLELRALTGLVGELRQAVESV